MILECKVSDFVRIDDAEDCIWIGTAKVSGDLLKHFTEPSPPGQWFRIVKVDTTITIETKREESDADALFADFPLITPGHIRWNDLYAILEWRERHGLGEPSVTKGTLDAMRDEGQTAARAGLEIGLIDYGQASGEVD